MHKQAGTREGNHQRQKRTINFSPPTQANSAARATNVNPPLHAPPCMHLSRTPHTHHTASLCNNTGSTTTLLHLCEQGLLLCVSFSVVTQKRQPNIQTTTGVPRSPRLATVQTSSVSSRTTFCSQMSPWHIAVQIHTWRRLPPLRDPLRRCVQQRR